MSAGTAHADEWYNSPAPNINYYNTVRRPHYFTQVHRQAIPHQPSSSYNGWLPKPLSNAARTVTWLSTTKNCHHHHYAADRHYRRVQNLLTPRFIYSSPREHYQLLTPRYLLNYRENIVNPSTPRYNTRRGNYITRRGNHLSTAGIISTPRYSVFLSRVTTSSTTLHHPLRHSSSVQTWIHQSTQRNCF